MQHDEPFLLSPRNFVAFEVSREEEFSPLKNADTASRDNPSTSRRALLAQHYRWALQAGAHFLDVHGVQLPEQSGEEALRLAWGAAFSSQGPVDAATVSAGF